MFRVKAVYALMLGVLMAAAAQAQQPMPPGMMQGPMMPGPQGPMMQGPVMLPSVGGPMMGGPASPGMGAPMFQDPTQAAPVSFQNETFGPSVQQTSCFGGDCGGYGHGGYGDCGCKGGPGCGPQGCDIGPACGPCCPPPGCPCIFNAEVEATFLHMDIDGTQAAGSFDAPALPVGAIFLSDDAGLDDDLTVVPRVWLHCQKCEWGLGARLWYLSDSESHFTPLNLLELNIIGDYSLERLEAWTGDLEVTYSWHPNRGHHYGQFGRSSFQLGFGGRYVDYENDSMFLANAAFGDSIAHASGVAKTLFDGTGFTSGARGTICLKGHVSLFWSVRGSYIWGDMTTLSQTAATAIYDVDPAAGAITSAGTLTEEELFIGEAQLGIQWEHQLHCVPATAFFRVAGEYQYWDVDSNAFSATNATVQVDVLPAPEVLVAASQAQAEALGLELFGLSIAAGFNW